MLLRPASLVCGSPFKRRSNPPFLGLLVVVVVVVVDAASEHILAI